jgi:PAS domain S-box-containing protein
MTANSEWLACTLDREDPLRIVLEGTATETGERFFTVLVKSLSATLGTRYAWITEYLENARRLKTLAFSMDGQEQPPFEIDIEGTPCQEIIERSQFVHYPDNIRDLFPRSSKLKELRAVSYMGVPLTDLAGAVLGHLAVIDTAPLPKAPRNLALFKIFAARAAAELRRIRVEKALKEREVELQALVNSAMDGIIVLDAAFQIVQLNPAARHVFGLPVEAGLGESIWSFLTPASRDRLDRLIRRVDTFPPGKRFLWIPDGLDAIGPGRKPFRAEVTVSRFEMQGGRYLTLILRNVNDRIETERQINHLKQEAEYLRAAIRSWNERQEIIGESRALQNVLGSAAQVAGTDATVLIHGETGTGKELIARYLHQLSSRAQRPYVKLNCAALQPTLVESEFFGHEAGAFTGAVKMRKGRFELADTGTLFLDEVSEIPLEVQAKLLRVLQEGGFERVGGSRTLTCDVRFIAATNRRIEETVAAGKFRADLYYRLNVYPIHIPPLRERREDIPPLVEHFLPRAAQRIGKKITKVPAATMKTLMAYDWPGNVRELKNVIERAVITSPGPALRLSEVLAESLVKAAADADKAAPCVSLACIEKRHITEILKSTGWRISGSRGAAAMLEMNPSTLRYRMRKHQIRRPWRGPAEENRLVDHRL